MRLFQLLMQLMFLSPFTAILLASFVILFLEHLIVVTFYSENLGVINFKLILIVVFLILYLFGIISKLT